jgi:hypothetical protein
VKDDLDDRKLMIHCGAALFRLKVVLKHFGCLGQVEVFPNLERVSLVAKIHFGSGRISGAQESGLFEAMTRDKNLTATLGEMPVDESIIETLCFGIAGEKAWLEFSQCELSRNRMEALAQSGTKATAADLRSQAQSNNSRVRQWAKPLLMFIVRADDSQELTVEAHVGGRQAGEMAALATLKTKTDDKHGWLATGHAIARAKLRAESLQISSQVFDQNFQHRHMREELRTTIGHKGFVQAIIGFGSRSTPSPIFPEVEQVTDLRPPPFVD